MTINKHANFRPASLSRLLSVAALGLSAILLASCGGGGTATVQGRDPNTVGTLAINPATGSAYALQPFTFDIAGGQPPYTLTSSEPLLFPLGYTTTSNRVTVVPGQPGVVDVGQDPNQVPSRRANVTVRDGAGTQATAAYDVLQNFTTGYSLSLSSLSTCGSTSATTATQACAGTDSLVSLVPITNASRFARKVIRLEVKYGAFSFVQDPPPAGTGSTGPSYTRTADDRGAVTARISVLPFAQTQYAQFRLTDVATGTYADYTFIILNADAATTLSVLPNNIDLTGPNLSQCGAGSVSLFPLGGKSPYTASATTTQIQLSPSVVNAGEAFNLLIGPSSTCFSGSVIVRDATGSTATVAVKTNAGTTAAILPFTATPNSVACLPDAGANQQQIIISGGNTNKIIAVSNPGLLLLSSATGTDTFVLTVTSLGVGGAAPGQNVTVNVSDGATILPISVLRKTVCP